MASERKSLHETALEAENLGLRDLLAQAGIDAARILAQAGIDATENEVAKRLQRLLLEELHHRVKNTLATVIGGAPGRGPTRDGFGTRLIGRLAEQLQGDVRLSYEPAGLVYELKVPLSALAEHPAD